VDIAGEYCEIGLDCIDRCSYSFDKSREPASQLAFQRKYPDPDAPKFLSRDWMSSPTPAKVAELQLAILDKWGWGKMGYFIASHPADVVFVKPQEEGERLVKCLMEMSALTGLDPGCLPDPPSPLENLEEDE
jgi:hypothetical protein